MLHLFQLNVVMLSAIILCVLVLT
jgi:hypothetical protein